jgi:Zn-finger nucleic acid-binding protein
MTTMMVAEVEVDVCKACASVWLDWFDGEFGRIARMLLPLLPASKQTTRQIHQCPRDGAQLAWAEYKHSGLRLARCGSCAGLFARHAELVALAHV